MKLVKLFLITCFLSGLFAALGSMVGNSFGGYGLWIGGLVGGILGAGIAALFARGRAWIAREALLATALGASIGFGIAAYVAVSNLSSPIVPILSTSLSGLGALAGQYLSNVFSARRP